MSIDSAPQNIHSPAPVESIEDVHASVDTRNIAIDRAGIKALRHPLAFSDRSGVQHSVAEFDMSIALSSNLKGTHMSRFVDILNRQTEVLNIENFTVMLATMRDRLEATSGVIEMAFPWFVTKTAPISGSSSMIDYQVTLTAEIQDERITTTISVVVPVTSLCPCSKTIAEYGAHNQRSHVTVTVEPLAPVFIEDLIDMVEAQASAELYGMLKRADEKYVTERAYNNPKFVEDMVRDVAACLNQDARIAAYHVEVENFESIHNHSAYAEISQVKS